MVTPNNQTAGHAYLGQASTSILPLLNYEYCGESKPKPDLEFDLEFLLLRMYREL